MDETGTERWAVEAAEEGPGLCISICAGERHETYRSAGVGQQDYIALYGRIAGDFGTRPAGNRPPSPPLDPAVGWRPLLTETADPRILYGYGDPAVLRIDDGWVLTCTSNDAPDSFPILFSPDLEEWELRSFAFAAGASPDWTLPGPEGGDFWAPEMARVGGEYWLSYTARTREGALSIGLVKAPGPFGPWTDLGRPLIGGGNIDAHLFVEDDGQPWMLWKRDSNGKWPRPLARLLGERPELIATLFDDEIDRRTAALAAAVLPFAESRPPIERFFLMQPLIRSVTASWPKVPERLRRLGIASDLLEAMTTPILAQRLSADGSELIGESATLLVNDRPWEAHLIEGPWLTRQEGRYWLFYAGNDFTSPAYGIGAAVADDLTGPYRKREEPLLRSTGDWTAPGHASVASGTDGRPHLFFHAYRPGDGGYNAFRALLTVPLLFEDRQVSPLATRTSAPL